MAMPALPDCHEGRGHRAPGEGIELRACGPHINTLRRPRKALPAPPKSECLANQGDQVGSDTVQRAAACRRSASAGKSSVEAARGSLHPQGLRRPSSAQKTITSTLGLGRIQGGSKLRYHGLITSDANSTKLASFKGAAPQPYASDNPLL
jgi:hypothetical protein